MINHTFNVLVSIGNGASKPGIPLISLSVGSLDDPPLHVLLLIGP